ncbi:MAG: DUF2520 domain-containing protein [Bacteroidia bacterium]|nr:DUF2520 domain-containing protein [Bacteroidia bacterium]
MKTLSDTFKSFVMIGTGNLSFHLCTALVKKGFRLKQVAGRTKQNTSALAAKFKAPFTTDLKKIVEDADYYFVCVSDDAIKKTASHLKIKNGIVIHCSGSVSISELKNSSENYGVFYPLYTFSKNDTIDFKQIPLFVEGNNSATKREIFSFAKKLSTKVLEINSAKREKLHLAAVMSANFSNFLFTLSAEFLEKEKAGTMDLLLPLIQKTTEKLKTSTSLAAQTGPARRKDKKVIDRHKELLKKYPEHKKIYKLLTSGIIKRYK